MARSADKYQERVSVSANVKGGGKDVLLSLGASDFSGC